MADYDRRNEASLRGKIIRLAHAKPELRKHLVPLLTATAGNGDKVQVLNENGRKVWVTKETLRGPKGKNYKPIKDDDKSKGKGGDRSKDKTRLKVDPEKLTKDSGPKELDRLWDEFDTVLGGNDKEWFSKMDAGSGKWQEPWYKTVRKQFDQATDLMESLEKSWDDDKAKQLPQKLKALESAFNKAESKERALGYKKARRF
jgi:hypothetical protein